MTWYDTHQAAVDPDNPAANEQITFDEWNAMTTYQKDKIIGKAVNDAAIGNDKVLVYKTATSTFVFEAQSTVGAINDLSDVTISGVPADNEVVAYDTGTSKWINQTAAEAGLATVAGLAAYYPLTGATLTGNLNMGDYLLDDVDDIQAYDTAGIAVRDSAAASKIVLATTTYAFTANATGNMGSQNLINVLDPTSAQHASTKNYDDAHLFTKEAVTSFTDGYVPVYRTASGKFEMEDGGGAVGLPVTDTTSIVKGSIDGTKLLRFEVDGITTGTTRVATMPDKDITLCGTDDVLLNPATEALDMDDQYINNCFGIRSSGSNVSVLMQAGSNTSTEASIVAYGSVSPNYPGQIRLWVPNAAKLSVLAAGYIESTDTPHLHLLYGLDMNAKNIDDVGALILNDATELTIDAVGQVTATQSFHTIDTYGDAATDDLDSIAGETAGQIIVIQAADSARTVVAKNGTDNLRLEGDMTFDNANDTLTLIFTGVSWYELSRSNNGA